MKIRMKLFISGGRADGTDWPPPGSVLEVEDREGAELCAAGLAEPVAEVEEPAETPEQPLETRTETRTGGPAEVQQPNVNAPKADWVAYAVSLGVNASEADALTKQQLVGRYGS